ncbi:MAG: hypothetical protein C5B50_08740 [Verrucomicrobia bacterium]|nr:MAG: hypothetical protein C5B50_08740 [Verrucomicrobiota bacterium]
MSPGTINCGFRIAECGLAEERKTAEAAGGGLCTPRSKVRTQSGRILQFKGLAGGVPQNTERTTVKPWVGI